MSIDLNKFDFGFTAVDENELEAVQKTSSKLESTSTKASELEEKLNNLYKQGTHMKKLTQTYLKICGIHNA